LFGKSRDQMNACVSHLGDVEVLWAHQVSKRYLCLERADNDPVAFSHHVDFNPMCMSNNSRLLLGPQEGHFQVALQKNRGGSIIVDNTKLDLPLFSGDNTSRNGRLGYGVGYLPSRR